MRFNKALNDVRIGGHFVRLKTKSWRFGDLGGVAKLWAVFNSRYEHFKSLRLQRARLQL